MQRTSPTLTILAGVALGLAGTAQAALIDRGSGLIYDDVLDITWLQDANYAFTSGYAAANAVDNGSSATDNIFANGRMGWTAANTWADNLSFAGYSDWRLPKFTGGTTCLGLNCHDSELAFMFYDNLGGSASSSILAGTNTANLALFNNLQSSVYWSGVPHALLPHYAWTFHSFSGEQTGNIQSDEYYAWAVRAGDVTAGPTVPTPAPLGLIASGLMAWGGWRRKR